MKKILVVFLCFSLFACNSCQDTESVKPEILNTDVNVKFIRFDSIFANSEPTDLQTLKTAYPYMFSSNVPDSLWLWKMSNPLQKEIEQEIELIFDDISVLKSDLDLFFKHLKYYFPKQQLPDVVTLAEYVDYKNKVILDNNLLCISLDNYLGKDHEFYDGFQKYIANLQEEHQILPDIAELYAENLIERTQKRDFLSLMVYEGKKLYFKEKLLPLVEDNHLIGYTDEEYKWANEYEVMIWNYFIEKDLLYDTSSDLRRRFLRPGPFTKFYLEIDNESPPRLGQYIGLQILKSYAEQHPEKSLLDIISLDEQSLFKASKYKP